MSPSQATMLDQNESRMEAEVPNVPQDAVLIMGATGSGKSTFISLLADEEVEIGHELSSCTTKVRGYGATVEGRPVIILDTPGFDDTARSDIDIIHEIVLGLNEINRHGTTLVGVIYVQRIIDPRMSGSGRRSLEILEAICGEPAFPRITFVTTMWDKLGSDGEALGSQRIEELKQLFWTNFVSHGAKVQRHDGTPASARHIMDRVLSNDNPIALELQNEMVFKNFPLEQTRVGKILLQDMLKQQEMLDAEKKELEQQLAEAREAKDRELVQFLSEDQMRVERQLQESQGSQRELRYNTEQLKERNSINAERQRSQAHETALDNRGPSLDELKSALNNMRQRTNSLKQAQAEEEEKFQVAFQHEKREQRKDARRAQKRRAEERPLGLWPLMTVLANPPRHQLRYGRRRTWPAYT